MSDDERMSVASYQTDATNNDDSTFRSPNISMRGRKRKPVIHDDGSELSFMSSPKRGRGRGGAGAGGTRPKAQRQTPKTTPAKKLANIDESSLINVVKSGKGFDQVINRWINEYGGNRSAAIAKIQQLFLHSCGCRGIFHMMPEIDYPQVIRNMSDEFDEDCAEYPIIQSGQQWKKFRQYYETFLKSLINKCQGEIIFDNVFMDNVVQMLTGLADSHVRAFRHTATFAAMKISTALVDLVVKLVEIREKTNLQIETEKTKLKQRGTNQQLEVLLETKAMYDSKINDLSDMTSFLFKSVFVHRYRDIVSDIRCICITELGQWMSTHPSYFLEDTYLKYVGWLLYDKQPEVRVKCITALLPLFDDFECIEKLEVFLTRFKDRLVTMIADKDIDVAVKACQLLTNILKSFPNLLEPNDCVPIYEQVYSANKQLAVASGEFLNSKFFEGSREGHNKELISDLILFYVEGEVHTHAAYLVDALLEISPIIKDWVSMTEMLLSDECGQYDSALVEIMSAAIRQSSTGEPPSGRATSKRAAKDLKQIQEDRTRISEVLIPTMARLLNRHIDDRDKIANLTTIPQYFILELYPTARMMKYLDELVIALQRVVEQHFDDEILSNIAVTFLTFHNNIAVEQHISSARAQMLDHLAVSLKRSLQLFERGHALDEQDEAQMLNGFRKINAFIATEDLRRTDLWDLTIFLLQNSNKISNP
jgi:cohesin complex subunit SA-1/2